MTLAAGRRAIGALLLGLLFCASVRADPSWPDAACVREAARHAGVPSMILLAIMRVEGGVPGQVVRDADGSYDMGPMQINSLWLPMLREIGITRRQVTDDGCLNVEVGASILARYIDEAGGDLGTAVGWYHSHTPELARAYRERIRQAILDLAIMDLAQAGRSEAP